MQKIRWRSVSGRVARFFDDVLVLASKSLPKRFTDALGPWDLSALEPYRPEYLAGFRAEGYTVEVAASGEAAVEQLSDNEFDLVLTDLMLPGISGIEVLKACRDTLPGTPVVIVAPCRPDCSPSPPGSTPIIRTPSSSRKG